MIVRVFCQRGAVVASRIKDVHKLDPAPLGSTRVEPHRQIEGCDVLRQLPHRDVFNAGARHLGDVVEADAARSLQRQSPRSRCNGGTQVADGEVVQQDAVHAGGNGVGEFTLIFHLHLDGQSGMPSARLAHRSGDSPGRGDVVFFEQYRVVEAHAMILATPNTDRIFLGNP